jgi:hypothetical protein
MKKLFTVLCLAAMMITATVSAQKEGNIWYFGSHAGLDFNSGTAVALQNGALWCNDNSSTVCDANGQLLFYTNSDTVWNRLHQVMANGTGLLGSTTSGQCGVIVPQPGTSKYYIFTNAPFLNSTGLNFSVVDMAGDNGFGAVVVKNAQLFPYTSEKLDAIYNPSDNSYWIITHPYESSYFLVYKLNSGGLYITPVISDSCAMYGGGNPNGYNAIGQMTISPDGHTIASGVLYSGFIELCDFNMTTGHISNSRIISDFPNPWGIAFSPDSRMLYADKWWTDSVFQYNIYNPTKSAASFNKVFVGHATATNSFNYQAGYMQLGPDNKIYIARYQTHYLAVINQPDNPGLECGFVNDGIYLGATMSTAGLSRTPLASPQLGFVATGRTTGSEIRAYPNPSDGHFTLICPAEWAGEAIVVEMADMVGKKVALRHFKYVDPKMLSFPGLKPGVYNMNVLAGNRSANLKICITR